MLNRVESGDQAAKHRTVEEKPLNVAEPEPKLRPTGNRRARWVGRIALGLLAVVAVLGTALAGLAWKATSGSVNIDLIRDRVETAVRARMPPDAIVTIGSTAFSYRRGHGVILRARDVALALPGRATIKAAEVSTVTTVAAALSGDIELQSVTASGVEVGVSSLGRLGGGGAGVEMIREAGSAFVAQIAAADDLMRGAGLQQVLVRDAALRVVAPDGRNGPALRITEANWLPLAGSRSKAWLQVAGADGAGWDLTVERRSAQLGGGSVTIEIEDLPVEALAPGLATSEPGEPYYRAASITLMTRIATARDGSLSGVRGTISTGSGELSLTGKDDIDIAGMTLSFALGDKGERLRIPNGQINTRTGKLTFEGVADLSETGQVTVLARVRDGLLPGAQGREPIKLTGGGALVRLDLADHGMAIERFHLVSPEGRVSAVGQATFGAASAGLSFALSMTEMPAAVARAFWPPFIATKTRAWFDTNVRSGTLGPATIQVALPPEHMGRRGRDKILPDYALIGTLPFRDGDFTPVKTLPPISNAAGAITFANATATVGLQSGRVIVPGRGDLDATGSD
jgi:hypothetical protein